MKLIKKIEASKLLLEHDIQFKVKKAQKKTLNFDDVDSSDESTESEEEEPKKEIKPKKDVKQWGTSTRNKKSRKPIMPKAIENITVDHVQTIFFLNYLILIYY